MIVVLFLPLLFGEAAGQFIENSRFDLLNELVAPPKNIGELTQLGDAEDLCNHLHDIGTQLADRNEPYYIRQGYDTLRAFIESCATVVDNSWHSFAYLDKAVSGMDNANSRWLEYRDWLKKVLYLSLDSLYYCSDATSILQTFSYRLPETSRKDYNGLIAVYDYLIESNRCPDAFESLVFSRNHAREFQVASWYAEHDSNLFPVDTSKVELDSIGLSILRGPENTVVNRGSYVGVNNLSVSQNPFSEETTLYTTLADATMLSLEIYDLLGKQLYSENRFFGAGDVKWKLEGKFLPRGTLYARVSILGSSPRTVRLEKK